jgi:hypothetical protein
MRITRRLIVSFLCLSVLTASGVNAFASTSDKVFGVVAITKERSTTVKTKDYGTLSCVSVEFQRLNRSLVIINGKSDLGFSGGMIYETDENGNADLFTPHSVWGGVLHHTEPGLDDAIIQVRLAVASICLGAFRDKVS